MPETLARILQASNKEDLLNVKRSILKNVWEKGGKKFPQLVMEARDDLKSSEGVVERNENGHKKSDDPDSKTSTDSDGSKYKIEKVNDMGLAYYFVLLDKEIPQNDQPIAPTPGVSDLVMNKKEAVQLLAALGFPSDVIESFFETSGGGESVNLRDILNFLSTFAAEKSDGVIKGDELNKIVSQIVSGRGGVYANFPDGKDFSVEEVRTIIGNIIKTSGYDEEVKEKIALKKPQETVLEGEISSFQGEGIEDHPSEVLRTLNDTFSREQINASFSLASTTDIKAATYNMSAGLNREFVEETTFLDESVFSRDTSSESSESVKIISQEVSSGFKGDTSLFQNFSNHFNQQVFQEELASSSSSFNAALEGNRSFGGVLSQQVQTGQSFAAISQATLVPQLATYIQQMRQLGQNHITFQLEPKELGKITVSLKTHLNKVSTVVSVENVETGDLLQRNTELLRNYLAEQGLSLQEFTVETGSSGDKGFMGGGQREGNFSEGSERESLAEVKGALSPYNKDKENHLIYFYA